MRTVLKHLALLTLLLALLPGAALAEDSRYPEKEHLPVDYADMDAGPFDETALQAALTALEDLCASSQGQDEDPQTRTRARTLYDDILAELDVLSTRSALIEIAYDAQAAGGEGEQPARALEEISAQENRLYDRTYSVLALLADTPYGDIIDDDAGEGAAESLREYEALTEEEAALYQEETRLIMEYDQIMARPGLSEEERNRQAGEIFCRLVQLRTRIARRNGYENYAEYAYEVEYGRDYSVHKARTLQKAVQTCILPLSDRVCRQISDRELRGLSLRSRAGGEAILDSIQPFFESQDPELGETFAFMRAHHLYDIEASEAKLPAGYTVDLPAYGTAFIFNNPYGDYQDYSDLVHEFGHFNETFHAAAHSLWAGFSIDVGEIHSQALELLFTSYADRIFGDDSQVYTLAILSNILDSIIEGCLYDEFQTAVYQDPDMSLEEINRLFKQISEEYGYTYEKGEEESAFWVEVSHNFQNPLYYISYATSALSSLDLWLRALENWDMAVEIYMDLTVLSLDVPYREAIRQMGLTDIFRRGAVEELAQRLEERLDSGKLTVSLALKWAGWLILVSVAFALILLALLLLTAVLLVRRRTLRRCREFQERVRNAGIADWTPQGPGGDPPPPR